MLIDDDRVARRGLRDGRVEICSAVADWARGPDDLDPERARRAGTPPAEHDADDADQAAEGRSRWWPSGGDLQVLRRARRRHRGPRPDLDAPRGARRRRARHERHVHQDQAGDDGRDGPHRHRGHTPAQGPAARTGRPAPRLRRGQAPA